MTTFVPPAGGRPATTGGKKETLADALCSGDPANCPACGTDPVLAAFCEAVADDGAVSEASSFSSIGPSISISRRGSTADRPADGVFEDQDDPMMGKMPLVSSSALRYPPGSSSISPPAPFSLPLPYRNASSTSVIPTLASLERHGYTIPDAFKQIRSHPAFPKWQGGLNLLADVVSGRAPTQGQAQGSAMALGATSPPYSTARRGLPRRSTGTGTGTASGAAVGVGAAGLTVAEERKARHPSVEIGPSLQRKTGLMESTDRDVMSDHDHDHDHDHDEGHEARPSGAGDAQRPSLAPLSALSRSEDDARKDAHIHHGHGHGHKRRRLYVENDRVEEALRMLDGGIGGAAAGPGVITSRSLAGLIPCGECPCPCPWAQQQQQPTNSASGTAAAAGASGAQQSG
jgi:hypothetical protein